MTRMIPCEGSGSQAHNMGFGIFICSMCGATVEAFVADDTPVWFKAADHLRWDILAELNDGRDDA